MKFARKYWDKTEILRFSKNMTQKQVSELTGIKIRTISKYEHDAFEKPRISILEKLASFYQEPLSEIIHKGD